MRRRWWLYGLFGLGFGILDWHFLGLLASLGQNQTLNDQLNQTTGILRLLIVILLISLNYGIWLVPVFPAAISEMRHSQSLTQAALAGALVWASAVVSYYGYYAILLMFVGLPQMEFMPYSNHLSPEYWSNWWPSFRAVILGQFLMWGLIALIAGPVVGFFSAGLHQRIIQRRGLRKTSA